MFIASVALDEQGQAAQHFHSALQMSAAS